jgi:beta-lactamase superfamily II metal-dependent hydrolase
MATIHFLNVLEGDCTIIQHDSGHVSVIDVCNADNGIETEEETFVRDSAERKAMFCSNVPVTRKNYNQKASPDNPIDYLNSIGVESIFRFIITHPDMDHMDGIKDLFDTFYPTNTWDTDNNKQLDLKNWGGGGYNKEDWRFYKSLRDGKYDSTKRLTYFSNTTPRQYWKDDFLKVLCPTEELVNDANEASSEDYNDISYVILFTPPKKDGGNWKIVFGGDSHDESWKHILSAHKSDVSNVDILFAPHHGRDSDRDWSFLETLKPKLTLMGNAEKKKNAKYLAYDKYPQHITNNQAGYIILDISLDAIKVYVKNKDFAVDFCKEHKLDKLPKFNSSKHAYLIGYINA